jgi:hypothetical protein
VINRSQKQKRRRTKHWIKEDVFDNAAEAEASIGNTWSLQRKNSALIQLYQIIKRIISNKNVAMSE